jgi:uncharacterized membrane protein YciS (DUF1049 family)
MKFSISSLVSTLDSYQPSNFAVGLDLGVLIFVIVYLRKKNEFGQNPEENIIFIGPGQYYTFIAC